MFEDQDGYWIGLYNLSRQKVQVLSYYYWPEGKDYGQNILQTIVHYLYCAEVECYGYWRGYIGDEVGDRWNDDEDLQENGGNPIEGAESIALERLIEEDASFVENHCEFVQIME